MNWHVSDTLKPFPDLLQCFNDYDTELKCSLTLAEGNNCTDHNLTASLNLIPESLTKRLVQLMGENEWFPEYVSQLCLFALYSPLLCCRFYTCRFDEILPGKCECTMQVQGFVLTEIFTINVQKGDMIWHTENISTEQISKWITVHSEGCMTIHY